MRRTPLRTPPRKAGKLPPTRPGNGSCNSQPSSGGRCIQLERRRAPARMPGGDTRSRTGELEGAVALGVHAVFHALEIEGSVEPLSAQAPDPAEEDQGVGHRHVVGPDHVPAQAAGG